MHVDDLIEGLQDGTKLLALLEVLSGERLVRYTSCNDTVYISHYSRGGEWCFKNHWSRKIFAEIHQSRSLDFFKAKKAVIHLYCI